MIRKWEAVSIVIALTALLFLSEQYVFAEDTTEPSSLVVEANTRFALKVFRFLANKTSDRNVLVAPTGLSLTFALLNNGADPGTRKEIEDTFEFSGISLPQLNQGFAQVREALNLTASKPTKRPPWMPLEQWKKLQTAPPNGTTIADSIWCKPGVAFSPAFGATNRRYYGTDINVFQPTPAPSVQVGNWARQRTKKSVPVQLESVYRKSGFILVDVTYFHEFWANQFDPSATKPDFFTLLSGEKKQVPFMHQRRKFRYFEGEDFQAVVLPYGAESMYVFLPGETSSLAQFESLLTADNWKDWLSNFELRQGHIGFPRFDIKHDINVRSTLETLGVKRAFQTLAAFSPLAPEGAMLTSATQSTSLKVDEQGTEAISIGIVGGVPGGVHVSSGPPPKPFEMIVNRPFFFAIVHESTKQLLFLGAVVEP